MKAAFEATFTDWRLVKGRKVVQVVVEVPVEKADAAYQVLGGMPDPGSSVWVAVARLDMQKVEPKPRKPVAPEKRLAQQAGICCADPMFQKFLDQQDFGIEINSEELAAKTVRDLCGVESRCELVPGSAAAQRWQELHGDFLLWQNGVPF